MADKNNTQETEQPRQPLKVRVITWFKRQTFLAVLLVIAYILWTWVFSIADMAQTIVAACSLLAVLGILLSLWRWGRGRKWAGKMFAFTRMVVVFAFLANIGAVAQLYIIKKSQSDAKAAIEAAQQADREAAQQAMQQRAKAEQAALRKQEMNRCLSDPYCQEKLKIEADYFTANKEDAYRTCASMLRTKAPGDYRWTSKDYAVVFDDYSVNVPDDIVTLNGKAMQIKDEFDAWQDAIYRCTFNTATLETRAELKIIE